MPLPMDEETPPVTKMYFVARDFIGFEGLRLAARDDGAGRYIRSNINVNREVSIPRLSAHSEPGPCCHP